MNGMPVFVRVDNYKEVLELTESIKTKIDEAKTVIEKIEQLKHEEDQEIDTWKERLTTISSKITFIDDAMTEHQ